MMRERAPYLHRRVMRYSGVALFMHQLCRARGATCAAARSLYAI